jgi:hypothetical protein
VSHRYGGLAINENGEEPFTSNVWAAGAKHSVTPEGECNTPLGIDPEQNEVRALKISHGER